MRIGSTLMILCAIIIFTSIAECFIARKSPSLGIIIPILSFVAAILLDRILFFTTFIFTIVFIVSALQPKQQGDKQKELDKMNIQDL